MSQLVERIRSRCEEVGECWEWQGALQKTKGAPVMYVDKKNGCVRRWIALEMGHEVEGKVVTHKCGNHLCVNPEHLQVMNRTAFHKRTGKNQAKDMGIDRRQRVALARRANAKLTPEKVQAIRDDTRAQHVIAQEYGISQSTVSQIKRGGAWRDYTNPFFQLL